MLEFHKNPGLGIRRLHEKGVTGKGINIAFIDYSLLVTHGQYYDRVKMYEEIHYSPQEAQMHNELETDFSWTAKAIERIIEVNKTLPKEDKIRVLSIPAGCQPETKGIVAHSN